MKIPYQITVAWSEEDESYVARVPALRGCLAVADTAEKAVKELQVAAELWLETADAEGVARPAPDVTLERLASLSDVVKLAVVAAKAGMSKTTLASKISRGVALSVEEQERFRRVLLSYGIN